MKSGDSGEAPVTPGQPERSHLYQLLVAKNAADRMPQKADPLSPVQITLIEQWIKAGAKFDGEDAKAPLISLLPQPNHPDPPNTYPRPVPILALAFSADGNELVAGGYHEITVWNPTGGVLLRRIKNMPRQIHALCFSPDGAMLAAAGGNPGMAGEVKLLNPKNGSVRGTLAITTDAVLALAFHPDGRRLIAGGADNSIRVFDAASGAEERRIEQHADWVVGLAFSPDGVRFASASRDKTARLFDAKTGELEETYTGHSEAVFGVAFGRDGRLVLTGGRDKKIHAWEPKDAKKSFELGGFESGISRLVAHGDQLFSCSADNLLRQYQLGDKKAELLRTYSGHRDIVYALAYHGPTQRLATGSYDGEVRLWDTKNGTLLNRFIAAPAYRNGEQTNVSR